MFVEIGEKRWKEKGGTSEALRSINRKACISARKIVDIILNTVAKVIFLNKHTPLCDKNGTEL